VGPPGKGKEEGRGKSREEGRGGSHGMPKSRVGKPKETLSPGLTLKHAPKSSRMAPLDKTNDFLLQGAYNSGKPGNLREFVNSGKLREHSWN